MESSWTENTLKLLVDTRLNMSQQYALMQRRLVVFWAALGKVLPAG